MNAPVAPDPAAELLKIFDDELETVVRAEQHEQGVYRSLKKLSELIGGEYGDRVIYELLQNAHDAHASAPSEGLSTEVAIHLSIDAKDRGELYVANGGFGFSRANVQAVRNIANSTKEVGEGIGNKGVGFRSVEALTDDPHIYSCRYPGAVRDHFDGYCFRFAQSEEVRERLARSEQAEVADRAAAAMPRYLAAMPLTEQPDAVRAFARRGFATVIRLPLNTAESVELARRQVRELAESDAPVLLFLERISSLEIAVEEHSTKPRKVRLTRQAEPYPVPQPDARQTASVVTLAPERRRWLLVRRTLPKEGILDAVLRSIPQEVGLKSWLNWRGEASVAVATPMEGPGLVRARLYTFLPMAADARSPCFAHIDAPFFTNISRRQARLDLPLNAFLLDAVAEVCASAALAVVQAKMDLTARCIVDLVAWGPDHQRRLATAFQRSGASLASAAVWPTTAKGWCGLAALRTWPEGDFKVFTASRATKANATNILSLRLPGDRIAGIDALARAGGHRTGPTPNELADWAEAIAKALPAPKADEERWSAFLADLVIAFDDGDDLDALKGRAILPDRSGHLKLAGPDVYVRHEFGRRRRHGGTPLPPASVARKLVILSDEVRPRQETVAQFERAGLWRRYDATEILERLSSLFGDKLAPARRKDALAWAFEVWSSDRQGARRALATADLHVETRGGWRPANQAAFSEQWTDIGHELDAFLAEARNLSTECEAAAMSLLVPPEVLIGDCERSTLRDWIAFLTDAKVVDGLVAKAVQTPSGPLPGAHWSWRLQTALGVEWRTHAYIPPHHPYTDYWRVGEAWMLPGQEVAAKLSPEAQRRFSMLVVRHLESFGDEHLDFTLVRTDRQISAQDSRSQATPLALFLMQAEWLPVEAGVGLRFVKSTEAWIMPERRSELRFTPRPPDDLVELLARSTNAANILCSRFNLKRWRDAATANARMVVLANICETISQHDRPQLQSQYIRAWSDFLAQGTALTPGTPLIVRRVEGYAPANFNEVKTIFVADGASADLARLLIDSGQPVLAINDQVDAAAVISAINAVGDIVARSAAEAEIRLLADGEKFSALPEATLLIDVLPWLADALVLGHELGARALERGASVAAIVEKLKRLRLRRVLEIRLQTGESEGRLVTRHMYRDEHLPTLIVAEPFDARRLEGCATILTDFLNQNLRTFELLLVKLAHRMPPSTDVAALRPSEHDYADALDCDVAFVREHLAAHRQNDRAQIELIVIVAASFAGLNAARDLGSRLSANSPNRWRELLEDLIPGDVAANLLRLLETTEDLSVLRRELGLDYARLNRAAIGIGRGPMTSETELHRAFAARKIELRTELRDRLRRHFSTRWRDVAALALYAEARPLEFVIFNPDWIETQETLSRETVRHHAQSLFDARFGSDPGGEQPEFEGLRSANRKAAMSLVDRGKIVLQALLKEGLPKVWGEGAKAVVDVLELAGHLDFELLAEEAEVIQMLSRAELWPFGVQQTLDLAVHGLSLKDLDREKQLEKERKEESERARNRVHFDGLDFDASARDFPARFAQAAQEAFAAADWRNRTSLRPVRLILQPEVPPSAGGGGGGKKMSKPPPKLPEAMRSAIGLAGELLAFEFLKAKHRRHFNDTCWVSENRASLFSEKGSISEGCDFRVATTEREYLYEVKATPYDGCEFELSDAEYRTAAAAAEQPSKDYRILFVQYAFDPARCRVLELPNPAGRKTHENFRIMGRSSVRMRFDLAIAS